MKRRVRWAALAALALLLVVLLCGPSIGTAPLPWRSLVLRARPLLWSSHHRVASLLFGLENNGHNVSNSDWARSRRRFRPQALRRSKTRSPVTSKSVTAPIASTTQSRIVSLTRSVRRSRTPPPTVTLSPTPTRELVSSDTQTLIPPPCTATVVALPALVRTVSYSIFPNAPPSLAGETFNFYEISSLVLANQGLSVAVNLEKGIVAPGAKTGSMFRLTVKDALLLPWLVSNGENVPPTTDFDSAQKHGIAYLLSHDFGRVSVSTYLSSVVVKLESFSTYRITEDEWLYISYMPNATIPAMCAAGHGGTAVVVRVVAPTLSMVQSVTQVFCIVSLVMGLVATISGSAVLTSHHAGMISIVASMQFAQEDGNPIGYAAYPFQIPIGRDKYRYVFGALVFNAAFAGVVFAAQLFVLRLIKSTGQLWLEAAGVTLFPRVTYSVVLHFAPGIFFACGRSFGTEQVQVGVGVVLMIGTVVALWLGGVRHIIQGIDAVFYPSEPAIATRQPPRSTWESAMKVLSLHRGVWVPTDFTATFMERNGYMLERYSKQGRWFQGIEAVDFCLTGLLTVIDNYTPFLACYQFGCTLLLKLTCVVFIIARQPARQIVGGYLLLLVYSCQIVAMCTLIVGSLRPAITSSARIGQDLACLVAALALFVDAVQTAALSIHEKREAAGRGIDSAQLKLRLDDYDDGADDGRDLSQLEMVERSQRRMLGWRENLVEGYLPNSLYGRQAQARDLQHYSSKPPKYLHELIDDENQAHNSRWRKRRDSFVAQSAVRRKEGDEEGVDAAGAEEEAGSLHSGSAAAADTGGHTKSSPEASVSSAPTDGTAAATAPPLSSSLIVSRRRKSRYIQDGDSDDSAYDSDGLPILSHPRILAKERGEKIAPRRRRKAKNSSDGAASSSETDSDPELVSEATAGNPHFASMTKAHRRQYLAALKLQKSEIQAVFVSKAQAATMSVKEARQHFWENLADGMSGLR